MEAIRSQRLARPFAKPQALFESWMHQPITREQQLVEDRTAAVAPDPAPQATAPFVPAAPAVPARMSSWVRDLATTSVASVRSNAMALASRHVCDGEITCQAQPSYRCQCERWRLFHDLWGIQIGGWFQGGILVNTDSDFNAPVLFNDRANEFLMNQLNIVIEKPVCADGSRWDFGGRIDLLYGTDSRYLTVPGLENHQDDTPRWNSESGRYGLALPQMYMEFAAPVRQSLSLKLGHFYAITGFESFPTPYNYFYSAPYSLAYGLPFTHTGALLAWRPQQRLLLQLGYTRGWDSWNSLADTYGVLGQIFCTSMDRRTALSLTTHIGQDITSINAGAPLTDDRFLLDVVLRHRLSAQLSCAIQGDVGYQKDGGLTVSPGPTLVDFHSVLWGGVTSYMIYDHSPTLTYALRLEWFADADQSRLGIPVTFLPGGPTFNGGNYYAATAGVNWRPNTNITVRPELRWDFSDQKGSGTVPGGDPTIRAFDSRSDPDQLTVGADLIVFF